MKTESTLNRRAFLRGAAMAAVSVLAASCAQPTPQVIEKEVPVEKIVKETVIVEKQVPVEKVVKETVVVEKQVPVEKVVTATPVPAKYKEAPMLTELVKAGKLPPVEERLPLNPKVANEMMAKHLKPEIGKYGGKIRTLTPSAQWDTDIFVFCNEPLINTPSILGEEITPNIAESFQVSPDQKEFTFKLRQGLKWSDGVPVTTEDVRFAYEDVLMNKELTPRVPAWLCSGNTAKGTPVKVSIVDNYTFKLTFDKPYGGFLLVLAIQGWRSYVELLKPAHYLRKFHKAYASEADLNAAIKKENVEGWPQLFALKDVTNWEMTYPPALDHPSLYPWVLTQTSQQAQVYTRNPYYFKVDAAGNQLPYIDTLESTYVADVEVIQMKYLAGECDFARSNPKLVKLPLYKENEAKGGFKTGLYRHHATVMDLYLNLTHKDPVWREVVRNVKFRQALALALDTEEIVDAVCYGNAKPSKLIPGPYDPQKAMKLLDEIGMDKKSADGYRLGPDGKVFEIPFETGAQRADMVPTLELVVQFWEKIGIRTTMKKIDGSLWSQRVAANELMATIYWSHTPLWWMGDLGLGYWGPLWNQWRTTGGAEGEEPPADVKAFYEKFDSIVAVAPEEGIKAYQECLKMLTENVYYIVTVQDLLNPVIYNAKLGNVAESSDAIAIAVNFSAEQFFYKS